jgi:hypothetical protein
VLLFEVASSFCLWEVDRIALASNGWVSDRVRTIGWQCAWPDRPWLGDAVHGGDAAEGRSGRWGGSRRAHGVDRLQITTALALPVLALPAIIGGAPVNRGLATAAYLGAAVVVLLIGAGAVLSRPTLRSNGSVAASNVASTPRFGADAP